MLFPLLLFLLAQDQPPPKASLSGTVTDAVSGAPLAKVQVVAEPSAGSASLAGTITDAQGNFSLVDLPPGECRLKGIRNGYLQTYYGARRAASRGITLTLGAGMDLKSLQLKLLPYAVIAGSVRDPEGEPLAGARVALIAITWQNGIRQTRATGEYGETDDLGQYRIPNVRPGSYYVRAAAPRPDDSRGVVDHSPKDAPPPTTLIPTFHPGSREFSAARKIEVAAGDRFTGADVTLLRSRLFRVRVRFEGPPGLSAGVGLHPRPNLGDGLGPDPPSDCHAGVCEFSNVPTGAYSAVGSTAPPKMTLDDLFSNSVQTRMSVPVDVVNTDVDGVRLVMTPPAEIVGRVVIPGEDHPDPSAVRVRFIDAEGGEHDARPAADGTFSARLSQERFEVQTYANGDLVVTAIRSDDADVLQQGLAIARPGKVPLEVTLAHDGAGVDGIVQDPDDRPVSGVTVVLIPETKRRFRHDLYREVNTDQFGRYRFTAVTPGAYRLFVWSDVEPDIWFDPDFLKDEEERGQAVTLDPKGHSVTNLRLLPPQK